MNPRLFSKGRAARALNMVDSSLAMLKEKGNLSYANELYNPENFFEEVHHISFHSEDSKIELENKTIKVHVLKRVVNRPLWHPTNVLFFLLQIMKITMKNGISVIRGRSTSLASFLGLLTGKMLRIPFIVSLGQNTKLLRELEIRFRKEELNRLGILKNIFVDLVETFVVRNADVVIAPSNHLRDYATSLKASEEKIKVIPWVLKRDVLEGKADKNELNRFTKRFNLDLKKPIVLYVGRLEAEKQVDVLIEAVPFVLKDKLNAQFVFIGDGSLSEKLRRRVEGLKVSDKVYFLGFHPTKVVKAFLGAASVVWIPMSGFVMFEAAAFSAPIVAFDIEWHREFISNGTNGILVENRNHEKMADAVIKMLDNPALARKYGKNARHKLMKEYNPSELKRKEIKVYKSILEKP